MKMKLVRSLYFGEGAIKGLRQENIQPLVLIENATPLGK